MNVKNHLANGEGSSIHWHGLYQRDTPWMDGIPMVTQCPIPAMSTHQYKFKAEPAGFQNDYFNYLISLLRLVRKLLKLIKFNSFFW